MDGDGWRKCSGHHSRSKKVTMCSEWFKTILTDAAGIFLAAGLGVCATAWFKAIRLSLQLAQIADVFRRIRTQRYVGFTATSDEELCKHAKAHLTEIKQDIDKDIDGIFRLSRSFRREVVGLEQEIENVEHRVFVAILAKRLSSDQISSRDVDAARALEKKAGELSHRAFIGFWRFLLP